MRFREHFTSRLQALSTKRVHEIPAEVIPVPYRKSAVILPFWPSSTGGVELVMTRRTETVSTHQGQVSFPGGGMDESDASPQAAALREAQEELGIIPEQVEVMGRLDDAWSRAGHHVRAYVGWLQRRPHLTPNRAEVAEVIIADVEILMRPESCVVHEVTVDGEIHTTPAFRWEGGYLWGISADLLLELFHWINDEPSNRGELRLQHMLQSKTSQS